MKQLSALDAQFLALEGDRNYGHVGSIAVLDPSTVPGGELTLDALKELLGQRLHLIPPFTQRVVNVPFNLDWPYWVDDEHFDLGYHVRELALPKPGTLDQLAEQTARIYSRKLDRARPLWELYLIHGLQGGKVALVSKIHHAAVDGMSGGEIMTMLYDLGPEGREVDPPAPGDLVPATPPRNRELLGMALASVPRIPLNAATRLTRLLPHVDVVPSVAGLPGTATVSRNLSRLRGALGGGGEDSRIIERPRVRPPKGAYDGQVSPHRIFGLGSVSLEDVKQVKDHFGVKVNDVVCSLVAGACREHLLKHGQLPDRPIVAQIPVSVRTEDERGTFGNQVSVMFAPLPTTLDDPVARLEDMHHHLLDAKERHGALPAKALRDVTEFIPPAVHTRAARVVLEVAPTFGFHLPFNVIVSNVPGPPIDIFFAGARLEAMYPLSIIADGALLNVTVMSYRDRIDIGITADRVATPDVQTIADGMQAELDRLVVRCGVAREA